jgi:hypothetical protein
MKQTLVYQKALAEGRRQEGWQKGRQQGEALLVLRLLRPPFQCTGPSTRGAHPGAISDRVGSPGRSSAGFSDSGGSDRLASATVMTTASGYRL